MNGVRIALWVVVGGLFFLFTGKSFSQIGSQKCGLAERTAHLHDNPMLVTRPSLQKCIVIGNVKVHYDTVGLNTPALLDAFHQRRAGTANAYADSVASIANQVLDFETRVLGYLPPPSDSADGGGTEYDIYIMDLGLAYYGYTMPQRQLDTKSDGGRYTSYIAVDEDFAFITPDSNKGLPALRITLAHELFHAIQLGSYGYWYNELYYYELSATWMEDVVFPNVNDYFVFLTMVQGHFRRPEVSFTSNDPGMYSRCTWGHYMTKKFGRESMRRSLQLIQEMQPLLALDSTLKENASSLSAAFAEWTKWNLFTGSHAKTAEYYPEGDKYPEPNRVAIACPSPSQTANGELPFLSARYYKTVLRDTTLTLALANTNLTAAILNNTTPSPYSYRLSTSPLDSTFVQTGTSVYVSLDVSDRTRWSSQSFVSVQIVSAVPAFQSLPPLFSLEQNYPNPFNPCTTIRFTIARSDVVSLKVFDLAGHEVATLLHGYKAAGAYNVDWNAASLASGAYFYRLAVGSSVTTRKMLVLR